MSIFSDKTEENLNSAAHDVSLEFLSQRDQILDVLTQSKDHGIAVGINAPVLGVGTHITAVDDIILDDDIVIVLKSYDSNGHMLDRNKIKLQEITSVHPFKSVLENPYMRTLTT